MENSSSTNNNIFISGTARFETRVVTADEFDAYRVLISKSKDIIVKAVDTAKRARGLSSPDLVLNGQRWELKCPTGNNPKKTIGRNINKAIAQMNNTGSDDAIRIIISSLATPIAKADAEGQVKRKLNEGRIDDLIAIYSESDVQYYKHDKAKHKTTEIPIALL